MRLALTALSLVAISLFLITLCAPVVFHGQIVTMHMSLLSSKESLRIVAVEENTGSSQADNTTKYFHEPGETDLLGHYDLRFFQGKTVSYAERTDTLHHMIRAYTSTFRDLHIETWIAHGTLLGWYWNEEILPWDWDLDVQVSGQALAYIGEFLNCTTHTYRCGDINREYFLDVNPFYKQRTRGDGSNIIDARWIDVRNGLFIDITGISETDPAERPGVWSCKNLHEYNTSDIWPLRQSHFEGALVMVPNMYDKVLKEEYQAKALNETEYEGHRWNDRLKKWIPDPAVNVLKQPLTESGAQSQLSPLRSGYENRAEA